MELFVLALMVIAYALMNIVWLDQFRRDMPITMDEAGYIASSFAFHDALATGGLRSLWNEWLNTSGFGPLTPLFTEVIHLLHGKAILSSLLVQQIFAAITAYAAYSMARHVASGRVALVVAFATLATPAFLDFARTYQFVTSSTAFYASTVAALLASRGLTRWKPSVAAGAFLGMSLLSRTMMVSFAPAIVLAALVPVVLGPERLGRLRNFLLAAVAALLVSATWYAHNWRPVFDYLTNFGYGDRSVYYGESHSPFSLSYWTMEITSFVVSVTLLPLAALVFAAFVAAGVARIFSTIRRRRNASERRTTRVWFGDVRSALSTPSATLSIVVLCDYAILSSSRNAGTGFAVPLAPLVITLAVAAAWSTPWRFVRTGIVTGLVAVSVLGLVQKSGLNASLGAWRSADVPVIGAVPVTNGRSLLADYMNGAAGYELDGPTKRLPKKHERWVTAQRELTQLFATYPQQHGQGPMVNFGLRDPLINSNAVLATSRLYLGTAIPMMHIESSYAGDTVDGYRSWLEDPAHGTPNLIVTGDDPLVEFPPHVTQEFVEEAARDLGYEQISSIDLPDGREARVFWRDQRNRPPTY